MDKYADKKLDIKEKLEKELKTVYIEAIIQICKWHLPEWYKDRFKFFLAFVLLTIVKEKSISDS